MDGWMCTSVHVVLELVVTKVCEFWVGELWRREGLEPVGGEEADGEKVSVFLSMKRESRNVKLLIKYEICKYKSHLPDGDKS